jgi:hypothetical protein
VGSQSAAASGTFVLRPQADPRAQLHFVRASGLAQARLQVAVLSGNRRRALEQIDRLVDIDRELEKLAGGHGHFPDARNLEAELADHRLALASEKLALTSEIALPRLEPAFGAGMAPVLELHEDVEIVEESTIKTWAIRLLLWAAGLIVLGAGVAVAALTQL